MTSVYSSPGRRAPPKRRAEEMTAHFAELQARLAGQPTAAIPSSGRSFPLGAAVLSNGINFSVFSRHASRVELLLFDDAEEPHADARDRPRGTHAPHLSLLARFRPRNSCRPALRLSRLPGLSIPSTASVSIRARFCSTHTGALSPCLMDILARRQANTGKRCDRDEKRSGRPQQLRLGGRCSIATALRQHGHLRDACRWLHAASEFRSRRRSCAGPTRG